MYVWFGIMWFSLSWQHRVSCYDIKSYAVILMKSFMYWWHIKYCTLFTYACAYGFVWSFWLYVIYHTARDFISWCNFETYGWKLVNIGPFWYYGLTLIPPCNYIHYEMWYEITYLFPNCNDCTVEVWECTNNFILLFTGNVIIYPYWD